MPRPRERPATLVLDLDDTLYYEAQFVRSGIAAALGLLRRHGLSYSPARAWTHVRARRPMFDAICAELPAAAPLHAAMLAAYRHHTPRLTLRPGAAALLARCRRSGVGLALVTDGRSATQRRKLVALGLEDAFAQVLISEELGQDKRSPTAYTQVLRTLPARSYVAVGDNPDKDFLQARRLGWRCYCVRDDGRHIHGQPPDILPGVQPIARLGEVRLVPD